MATAKELRSLTPEATVSMYEVDLRPIGVNRVFRFVNSVLGGVVQFDGNDYVPWDIKVEGLILSTTGPLPEPTVKIFNYENTIIELLDSYDPRGARFAHRVISRRHLDDGSDPNPSQEWEPEEYEIHAYDLGDSCQLLLAPAMAKLSQDFPKDTIATVRNAV